MRYEHLDILFKNCVVISDERTKEFDWYKNRNSTEWQSIIHLNVSIIAARISWKFLLTIEAYKNQ